MVRVTFCVILTKEHVFCQNACSSVKHTVYSQGDKKMALQFWFGASGSGKSIGVSRAMIEAAMEHPENNYFMIVPDQFTMQTQKQMVKMHPDGGILNIDVLSFGRLSHRIFEEVGKDDRLILDDTGKCLLLRKAAEKEKENIPVLAAGLKNPGFIQEIKSVLSEFMQYGLKPSDVKELASFAKEKRPLSLKLDDLSIIYEAFLKECEEHFITKEETLDLLTKRLPLSDKVKKSTFVFDGFTGFTPIQNQVIAQLLVCAKDVIVTLEMDHRYSPYRIEGEDFLFHLTRQTVYSLQRLAQECNVKMKEDIIISEVPVKRFESNPMLAHLERNLFREECKTYAKASDSLRIVKAANVRQECALMCAAMFELIQKKGYRYRDIAVVTGDMGKYEQPLRREFEKYGIPYFMDTTKSLLSNPFVAYLRNAIAVIKQGFRYGDVFRFLRTGMTDISQDDVDKLENYVRARGIRGYDMWNREFVHSHKESAGNQEELSSLNELRIQVVSLFEKLYSQTKAEGLPAVTWCKLFYEFCVEGDLQKRLEAYADFFEEQDDLSAAIEYRQIYRLIMELFNQIAELLGEDILSLQEFSDILDAGFAEIRVRSIPQGVDTLVVGDIERTRLKSVKALFFLGVNDGNIPQSGGTGGLISDLEREFLLGSGRELAPTPQAQMFIEHLYLYMNLTKPSEILYLSYVAMEDDGSALRPAYLIAEIKKLFPALEEEIYTDSRPVLALQDAKERIAMLLSEYVAGTLPKDVQKEFFALYGDLSAREECREWLQELTEAAFIQYKPTNLEQKLAEDLYGKIMECSISSLERFAACHYAHFLSYGLQLKTREEYGFAHLDMGNVMHDILQSFGKALEKNGLDWTDIEKETMDAFIEKAVEEVSASYGGAILKDSAKHLYFINQLKRIVRRTVSTLQEQLRHGTFRPVAFEKEFRHIYNFDQEGQVRGQLLLRGRIDRIDTAVQEDEIFVKVVDYKSGNHAFDLNTLYYGVALQLAVYLGQTVKNIQSANPDKKVVPAAMLYYRTVDPLLNADAALTPEESEKEILKELNNTGAVSARAGIVEALDEGLDGKSMVVPVTKKGGDIRLSDSVFDPVFLNAVLDFAQEKVVSLAEEITRGEIDIHPLEVAGTDACEYCDYKGACGFDRKIPGYEKCKPAVKDKEELKEEILSGKKNESEEA